MIDVSAAVKSAEELDKAVGILAKLVGKLKSKPDLAAQKLGQALGEVAKTLFVVDNAASEFLSLGIDEGALAKNSKLLLDIDGGSLRTEVERGRGHCHAIEQIYLKYLDRWFESAFNPDEYLSVKSVFQQLGNADGDLFYALEQVGATLEEEAGVALDFIVNGKEADARSRVLSALPALRPLRRIISKTMQTLYSMQGEFVEITNAV
jgi:hypothetical protein